MKQEIYTQAGLSIDERERLIISYLKACPGGVSTASIPLATGIPRSECASVLSRMKHDGTLRSNGSRGHSRWIYKPVEQFPCVNSIWHWADMIAGRVSQLQISI